MFRRKENKVKNNFQKDIKYSPYKLASEASSQFTGEDFWGNAT